MTQDFLKRIDEAVLTGDFDTAELLFLEEMEEPESTVEVLTEAARRVAEAGERERAAEMLAGLQDAAKAEGPASHLSLLRAICLCVPHRQIWRRAFVSSFSDYYAESEVDVAYLRAADIPSARNLEEAFGHLDTLRQFSEGAYIEHPGGWGIGKIRSIAPLTGHMVVDLEGKRGHRVNIGAAATIFRPIPADHFSAMLFDRPGELKSMATESPGALVRLLLRSFGSPQFVADFRERLVPGILPKDRWSNWWNRARTAVKNDPYLRLSGAPRPRVEILLEPVSEVDELLAAFREGTGRKRLAVVRQFKALKEEAGRGRLREELAKMTGDAVSSLEVLLLRNVLGDAGTGAVASFLLAREDGPALVRRLKADELSREAVRAVGATADFDAFIPYFLAAEAATIDVAAQLLREKDEQRFLALLEDVYSQPRRYVWPFLWLSSVRAHHAWEDVLEPFPPHEVLLRHLGLLDFLFRAERREEAWAQIEFGRSALMRGKLKPFRTLIEKAPAQSLPEIYTQVEANRALKEEAQALMLEKIAVLAPEIVKQRREKTEAVTIDKNVVYVTEAGLKRRHAEYQELVQEKIPQAIAEVGRAQEFGDLSENAEWTAALEKRDQLAARAQEMQAELKRVAVILPEFFQKGRVSLGCEVTVRNLADNTTQRWRLLGPWDGDLSSGVVSYMSPVGQTLLGRKEGEIVPVTLPDSTVTYEIVSVDQCNLE